LYCIFKLFKLYMDFSIVYFIFILIVLYYYLLLNWNYQYIISKNILFMIL
jgi:hypothetical protein